MKAVSVTGHTTSSSQSTGQVNNNMTSDVPPPLGTKHLFERAYDSLQPSAFFRKIVYLYAERRLHVFFWMHGMATLIVWVHFFLIKYQKQKAAVPPGAPFYNWKTLAPPLEFGSMHAILLQMAILPLTMSRYTIATLSPTWIRCYLPLNRTINVHIFVGYVCVIFIILASVVFAVFFGLICASGDAAFCAKFTSTIMITGYVILFFVLLIAATSHMRHVIPYEVFYVIHHLVFVLYALTVAHTLDQRGSAQKRAQTFKWFSLTILYYVCDRCAMHFFHSYRTRLASCSSVIGPEINGGHGTRLLLVKLLRPPLFAFHPGQYAYLKVAQIDRHWHPFSIASEPSSNYLEFYIECCGVESWTDKLWDMVQKGQLIDFDVQGPVGTSLAQTQEYSHAIAIGTGTGIVPLLSLFKQHVRKLMRLDPHSHFEERQKLKIRVDAIERAQEARKGSLLTKMFTSTSRRTQYEQSQRSRTDTLKQSIKESLHRRDVTLNYRERDVSIKEFKQAAFQTTRSIYGVVLLAMLPVFGMGLIGFTISWNTLTFTLPFHGMFLLLQFFTILFQAIFFVVAVAVWDANNFFAYTDAAISLLAPVLDWYWFFRSNATAPMPAADITNYCLLTAYMTARAWSVTVKPRSQSWQTSQDGSQTLERLEIIWASRSASLVSEIIPDINALWNELVNSWGLENAKSVCCFHIYVTDKDEGAKQVLRKELANTILYQQKFVHFGRPNFDKIIETHSVNLIESSHTSNTLLAYVGSTQLAAQIHECKLFNDMKVAITGNKKHQMDFVSESYGGVKSCKPKEDLDETGSVNPSIIGHDEAALTTRHTVLYEASNQAHEDSQSVSFDLSISPKRSLISPRSTWSKTSLSP